MKPSRQQAQKIPQTADELAADDAIESSPGIPQRPSEPAPELSEYDYSNFFSGAGNDPFDMIEAFDTWWQDAFGAGYYLFGQPMHSPPTTRVNIVEKKTRKKLEGLVNFASYNYLGLSYRPDVIAAANDATRRYGTGASGSPILSGTLDLHEQLADKIAAFKGKEAAIIFSSGYSANLGVIAGLMRSGDLVVTDQYAHASVIDGIILSKANVRYFRHNSIGDLDRKLKQFPGKKLVVVEGVYSMDGDLAKLPEIVDTCRRRGARLMVDEAHSTFIFGRNGRGVVEHFGVDDEVDIHFGTFSKSLGGIGGYVAGSRKMVNYLRGFARSHLFSCALPPGVVAGLIKALEIVQTEPEIRAKLWDNVKILQDLLKKSGVDIGDSASQVIPIMIRDDKRIFALAEEMLHEGVYLNPVRYPAVGKHRSRFRISVTAAHTREQLEEGAAAITRVLQRNGLCH